MRRILDSRGFSLVQILIGSAISIGLMLAFSQMLIVSSKNTKLTSQSVEFNSLVSSIRMVLDNEKACTTALSPYDFDPAFPGGPVLVPSLSLPGGPVAEVGKIYGGVKVTQLALTQVLSDLGPQPGAQHAYLANFHLDAEKEGAPTALKNLKMDFTTTIFIDPAKNIVKCY